MWNFILKTNYLTKKLLFITPYIISISVGQTTFR